MPQNNSCPVHHILVACGALCAEMCGKCVRKPAMSGYMTTSYLFLPACLPCIRVLPCMLDYAACGPPRQPCIQHSCLTCLVLFCFRSVSIAAPVGYAHLAAKRARLFVDAPEGSDAAGAEIAPHFSNIHRDLEHTMFYV